VITNKYSSSYYGGKYVVDEACENLFAQCFFLSLLPNAGSKAPIFLWGAVLEFMVFFFPLPPFPTSSTERRSTLVGSGVFSRLRRDHANRVCCFPRLFLPSSHPRGLLLSLSRSPNVFSLVYAAHMRDRSLDCSLFLLSSFCLG